MTGDRGEKRTARSRRRGTPRPEWGDNVIQGDFGGRRRAEGSAPRRTGRAAERRGGTSEVSAVTEGWAGRVILDAVCAAADTARIARGREYHRSGNVLRMDLDLCTVSSLVAGSQLEPFEVNLRWRPLTENQVSYVRGECVEHPENLRLLLAGKEPRRDVAAVMLRPDGLRDSWCTCPDRSGMCKHRIAVARELAVAFTAEPTRFLGWRGLDVDSLVRAVEAAERRRHGEASVSRGAAENTENTENAVNAEHTRAGDAGDAVEARYSATEFWGDLSRLPRWERMPTEPGVGLGDTTLRNAALRKVSWNTVDQLRVIDELESCYALLSEGRKGEHMFDREPWLSDPDGRIGDHD